MNPVLIVGAILCAWTLLLVITGERQRHIDSLPQDSGASPAPPHPTNAPTRDAHQAVH